MQLDKLRLAVALSIFTSISAQAASPDAMSSKPTSSFADALSQTKLLLDTRMRYEGVEQEPLAEDAEAVTLRARLGFETGKVFNTALLAEGEFVWPIVTDYNSTTNGKTQYPIVADPESHELNRLQLTNTSLPGTTLTMGRQRILLDDQRFVGNVGWRQNEQTFDSLRLVNKSIKNVTFDVAYISQVNRVFGKESLQGRYEGDSILANASYQLPLGKLTGFGYLLEFDPIAALPAAVRDSSETYGVRFAGEKALPVMKLGYAASYATQSDRGDNPLSFELDYYLGELTASISKYSIGVGYEVLEGNGTKGFTTPLATLHKFQGWADKFLATPADGIEDAYANVGVNFKALGPIETLSVLAVYHDYGAQRVARDYGTELNFQVQAKVGKFNTAIKYGDYQADGFLTDTKKYWVQFEYVW